jgi:hypothetical protein
MRRIAIPISVAALALASSAGADEIRHLAFPGSLLGTWAETTEQCASQDPSNVVVESNKYGDAQGSCAVRWIVETAGSNGANYAAHSLCTSAAQPPKTQTINIIIRPQGDGRAMMGRSFGSLKSYQRCPSR